MKMTYWASWLAFVLPTHNGEVINLNRGCSDLNLLSFCLLYLSYSQISNLTYKRSVLLSPLSFQIYCGLMVSSHSLQPLHLGKQWQWIHMVKF